MAVTTETVTTDQTIIRKFTFDADGKSPIFQYSGQKMTFIVGHKNKSGDGLGGGTVKLECAAKPYDETDGADWFDEGYSTVAHDLKNYETEHAGGMEYRWDLSGSTTPDLVIWVMEKIR